MLRFVPRISFAAPVLAVAMMFTAATANAASTNTVIGGLTTVSLSSKFTSTLSSLNVKAGTVLPSLLVFGTADFPITGGAMQFPGTVGQIIHDGGLTLTDSKGNQLILQSFILTDIFDNNGEPGSTPPAFYITAIVSYNGTVLGRSTVFDVALPSSTPAGPSWGIWSINGAALTLDPYFALGSGPVFGGALKGAGGLSVGSANISAIFPIISPLAPSLF